MNTDNQQKELEHDKKILAQAEKIWGRAGKAGELRLKERTEMIIDYCNIGPDKKILEIGCGTGALTEELAKTGAKIITTDIFPDFLRIVESKIKTGNVTFEIADAQRLDAFSDNTFDAVCGLSILHHLDINKTLSNIYRVLKLGGKIAFSEPNMLNPQIAIQKNIPFIKKILGDSPGETAFFSWQMKKNLKKCGFGKFSVTPFDFLHPSIPDSLADFFSKTSYLLGKTPLIKEIAGSLFITAKK